MVQPYVAYEFTLAPLEPTREILIAELAQLDFESFEETENGLLAYVPQVDDPKEAIDQIQILEQLGSAITYTRKIIPPKNWNAVWERDFKPVHISDQCVIRAPFHAATSCQYEIVIQPKMSFGTGHHATTTLMLQRLLELDVAGKKVLDMGTGTGVLGILANKMGAQAIDALDIDSWSFENAKENCALNGCTEVEVQLGDIDTVPAKEYDLILANINRNVLLHHIPHYAALLAPNGVLLMSGFYEKDLAALEEIANFNGLLLEKYSVTNDWTAALFKPQASTK
jgi:ribosomal protein L11 methyltransferase